MKKEILCIAFALVFMTGCGQSSEVFCESSRAIRGYDPVAYFTEGKPVKGDQAFTYRWNGANWYFSTQQNLELFTKNPLQYAPQYGGYCAYGCSEGHKAPTDPSAWTIVDGKLYLNYSPDVKKKWVQNLKERIDKADQNWPTVKSSK